MARITLAAGFRDARFTMPPAAFGATYTSPAFRPLSSLIQDALVGVSLAA
jgi:hypothetical protein